jgi:hypothetical protein
LGFQNKVLLGVATWGDEFSLKASDGRSEKVIAKYTGVSFRYELIKEFSEKFGWGVGAQALILQGDAQSTGATIVYQENIRSVYPTLIDTGFQWRPHQKISLGFSFGLMNYILRLQEPSPTNVASYEFQYSKNLQTIAQIKLDWALSDHLLFQQSLLVPEETPTLPAWTMSLGMQF